MADDLQHGGDRLALLAELERLETQIRGLFSQFTRKPADEMTSAEHAHDADLTIDIAELRRQQHKIFEALGYDDRP
jgi:hypothetical protein